MAAEGITEHDMLLAHIGPAPYVNRAYVILNPDGGTARVAFLDQAVVGHDPQFRAAVTISISNLMELRDIITQLVGPTPQNALATK